ncbi:MAG: hypothetical protein N2712_04740 [Brevinematales bacterium]|nr:hypothetical protein [Brevinematales bacterium]
MSYNKYINYFLRDEELAGFSYEFVIKDIIYRERTPFQLVEVVDTEPFGKALITDGIVMITDLDEAMYHEMMVHLPMSIIENPEKVLVIGGGDGGVVRELSKYPSLKKIEMVEIDERIVDITQKYMNTWNGTNFDILHTHYQDGFDFIRTTKSKYDLIILDISAPIDIAIDLYSKESFSRVVSCLSENGVFVIQSESIFTTPNVAKHIIHQIKDLVRFYGVYYVYVPSFIYPWSFVIGSKGNPVENQIYNHISDVKLTYYSAKIHSSSFALPEFIRRYIYENPKVELNLLDRDILKQIIL